MLFIDKQTTNSQGVIEHDGVIEHEFVTVKPVHDALDIVPFLCHESQTFPPMFQVENSFLIIQDELDQAFAISFREKPVVELAESSWHHAVSPLFF
jgi:hypothetical protein